MKPLTHRERVLTTLDLQEPDRVPLDLGGSASNMTDPVYFAVKALLGIEPDIPPYRSGRTCNYYDERVLEALDIDFRWVSLKSPEGVLGTVHPGDLYFDEWGVGYKHSGPEIGIVGHPLAQAGLDDLEAYPWPDPRAGSRDRGLREQVRHLHDKTDFALAARPTPGFGVFELCCALRGDAQYLIDLVADKPFAQSLARKITDVIKEFYTVLLEATGPYLHMVEYSGDYGTQQSMIISPATYREMMKPFDQEIVHSIKAQASQVKVMHHSCGAIRPIIPDLIETGIDVLNPLQPLAEGMDSTSIKATFGHQLCFHGAIDIQQALPGTLQQVEQELRTRVSALAPGGGYILAPANYVQPDVPAQNLVQLYRLAAQLGKYPLTV